MRIRSFLTLFGVAALACAPEGCGNPVATTSGRPASFFPPTAPADPAAAGLCPLAGVTVGEGKMRVTLGGDVLFDTDKSDLKPAALDVLARVKTTVIDAHPDSAIVVEGHTDDRASLEHNQALSERRAASVAAWLRQNGIADSRIQPRGYGKLQPRVPNNSDANRQLNRRVELVVSWGREGGSAVARSCSVAQACCELATLSGRTGAEPGCIGMEPGPNGWGADLGARGLEDNEGVLSLNPCLTTRSAAVWITSTDENMIARLNESDGKQAFRVSTHGQFPQRTAVAADGSVWVTNRDSGSYVHISGDGKLLCSSAFDTCVTRAAAVDSRGFAWIGCHSTQLLIQVSPNETDGSVELRRTLPDGREINETAPKCKELGRVETPEVSPYGLVADRRGGLWVGITDSGHIAKVDSVRRAVALSINPLEDPLIKKDGRGCWGPYGIGIDRDGNPWYANRQCGNVVKFDGQTGRVLGVFKGDNGDLSQPRALGFDREGHAWIAENGATTVVELAGDGKFMRRVDVSSCGNENPLGIAADSQGDMWTAIQDAGRVVKYRTDGTILGCYPDGNTPPFKNAYTYSDFTGAAMEASGTDRGVTWVRFSNPQAVKWRLASWSGLTPAGTGLCVRARSAASADKLDAAGWSEATCPRTPVRGTVNVTLDGSKGATRVPDGAALELELSLSSSNPAASPLLVDLSVAATPANR